MFTNTGRTHGEGLGRSHVLYRCLWGIDFSTFKDGNNRGHLQPLQGPLFGALVNLRHQDKINLLQVRDYTAS